MSDYIVRERQGNEISCLNNLVVVGVNIFGCPSILRGRFFSVDRSEDPELLSTEQGLDLYKPSVVVVLNPELADVES